MSSHPQAGKRVLMEGNYATAEGAIAGGCRAFFGYPITPQSQIPEYMSWRLPEVGGVFVQAESEVASINMVYGAAAAGARVMTTSSSPGISLMQEGLSYILGSELPCVIVNMVRGGPGLGNIAVAQSDYWLSTRGAGHGDGRPIVLAPYSVQELHDMTADAFAVAEEFRLPVMIQGDAILATMMEPCLIRGVSDQPLASNLGWTVGGGLAGRERNIINSLWTDPPVMEAVNLRIADRLQQAERLLDWEEIGAEEPDVVLCAYGIMARVCETVVAWGNEQGLRLRLLRPRTLVPFPYAPLRALAARARHCLAVELSLGQLVDDVRLAVGDQCDVSHYGRAGGPVCTPEDVLEYVRHLVG